VRVARVRRELECRNGLDPYYDVQLADFWSLGIILINLLYHRCPWSDPCPLESYAFSEFLRGRVDFLQRRFEDMPGPVARWLGLRAFSFAAFGSIKTRKHNRPRLKDWKEWMNDFVDRMLGQIEPLSDDEDDDEGEYETTQEDRKFLALFEEGYERQETMGCEPEGEDLEEDEEEDNQVVPIAIQSSSLKTQSAVPGYMGVGPQYATYHNAPQTKSPNVFMSSSVPKFDASSFYQPARLRQESWSNAIDVEGTEDAEMDFSAPILFEESEEEDTQTHGHDDNDDSAGLPMALPDDFIDPLPESNSTSGRQTPSTPTVSHLTFNSEKRHMLPQLRLDLDPLNPQRSFQDALQGGRASPGRISPRKSPGRSSPSVEMQDINTLVFIEPDAFRTAHETNPGTAGGHAIASSLPSTSHLDASLQAKKELSKGGQVINNRTGKPIRNLQEVKAAPFIFPPLKTNAPNLQPATVDSLHSAESPTSKFGQSVSNPFVKPERGRNLGMKDTPSASSNKQGIYVIPKRSLQGGWAGPSPLRNADSNPAAYAGGIRRENWRGDHTRGSSWTPEDFLESRRGSSDRYRGDGYRVGSGRTRTRMDDRDDGPGGLPPRAENKFRPPRYRQGRGRYPANTVTSALPPAPPSARGGFGNAGAPRSRHQSRSGSVFDNGSSWTQQHNPPNYTDFAKPSLKDNTPRDGPKYEHSQLRTHAKTNSGSAAMTPAAMAAAAGISKLSGQRNKSLVDLRGLDATNQPWRQTGSTSTPATPVIPKTRSQAGSNGAGGSDDRQQRSAGSRLVHPLEPPTDASTTAAASPVKSRLTDRLQEGKDGSGAGDKGDNVYHPPHWHERRSVSNAGSSPRPLSGTENDFMGWQRSDGQWNEGGHFSKSRSGSKARQPGGAHPLASVPLPSPTFDRKYGASTTAVAASGAAAPPPSSSRLAGGSDSNWREGGRESFGVSESRDHVNGNNKRGPSLDQGGPLLPPSTTSLSPSSVSAPPTLSKASLQGARLLESPSMTFTPPTPNVNIKHDFLASDSSTAGDNNDTTNSMTEESKKVVRPGAMAGLGNMLRGLVAYNKNIKVGGESVLDATSTTSSTATNEGHPGTDTALLSSQESTSFQSPNSDS